MKILLLDNEPNYNTTLASMIKSQKNTVKTKSFENDINFYEYLNESRNSINAVIISLDIKNNNALDLVSAINKKFRKMPIILTTSYPEKYFEKIFIYDAFFTPFALLKKPYSLETVKKILDKLYLFCINSEKTIIIKNQGCFEIINADDIIYIESNKRKIILHCNNNEFYIYKKLTDFQAILPEYFLMPHSSFLVNTKHIKKYSTKDLTIAGDIILPISRGKKDEFFDKLKLIENILSDT